jgi:hypothetical protein
MSFLQKSSLGPGRAVSCKACGKKVMAHWVAVFAAIPAFLGGMYMMKSGSLPLGIAAIAAGLVGMAALQTFAVPLVRGEA